MSTAGQALAADREASMVRMTALSEQLDDLIAAAHDSNLDDEHDPEGATLAFEREQLSALRDRARTRVAEIDAALRRVEKGEYGICRRCGSAIPHERLAALPAVSDCVDCARRRR